jgi:hypothetical protein
MPTIPSPTAQPVEAQTFTGTLIAGSWVKQVESYCHGGSDYFLLATSAGEYVLNSERDLPYAQDHAATYQALHAQLAALVDQPVTVRGVLVSRAFSREEHCPNPNAQCLEGPLTCNWIRVAEARAADAPYP